MKKLNFLVSLTNNDNDYQQEQQAAAEKAGRRLGVDVKIVHANNDAVTQSQQLLHYIQGSAGTRPDAIVFEPAGGTAFPQVARAAVAADIGWVVLNHDADYLNSYGTAVTFRFSVSVPITKRWARFKESNLRRCCRRADRCCIWKVRRIVRQRKSGRTE